MELPPDTGVSAGFDMPAPAQLRRLRRPVGAEIVLRVVADGIDLASATIDGLKSGYVNATFD